MDVWDALRSDRPYRAAWPEEKVRAYLRAEAGKHFDPEMVRVFLDEVLAEADGAALTSASAAPAATAPPAPETAGPVR